MSTEVAQQVVFGIAAIALVVWLFSLNYLVKSAGLMRSVQQTGGVESSASNVLAGSAEVEGAPKSLTSKAAAILAKGRLGPVKIIEKTDDRLVFEHLDPGIGTQPPGRWFRRAEICFTALGQNRTRVEWTVEPLKFHWLLRAASIVQVVGLIALVGGCWAMFTFVASSSELAARWQSVQMLQVVHLLWPPFVLGARYRKGIQSIVAEFEALVSNLPYQADQK